MKGGIRTRKVLILHSAPSWPDGVHVVTNEDGAATKAKNWMLWIREKFVSSFIDEHEETGRLQHHAGTVFRSSKRKGWRFTHDQARSGGNA